MLTLQFVDLVFGVYLDLKDQIVAAAEGRLANPVELGSGWGTLAAGFRRGGAGGVWISSRPVSGSLVPDYTGRILAHWFLVVKKSNGAVQL